MPSLVLSALVGAVFGVVLAAPPGPMNAIIAEESVLRGWPAGFKAGLGAMLADALFFALAYVGAVAIVARTSSIRAALYLLGGALMLYFAVGALRDAGAARSFSGGVDPASTGFRKAFALALTNPYQIVWWLTAGVALLDPGSIDAFGLSLATAGGPTVVVGFFGGILCWAVGFPAMLVAAGNRVDAFAPAVAYASALVLAGFGLSFLYGGLEAALALLA